MLTPSEEKKMLRKKFRSLSIAETHQRSQHLCAFLLTEISSLPDLRKIGFYAALGFEPDLSELYEKLPDRIRSYPLVDGDGMDFHEVCSLTDLVVGPWGISQPSGDTAKCERLDLIICPGVAFGKHGSRLGKGKGFYDRYLATLPQRPLLWGVQFSEFVIDTIAFEAHDVRMDRIFTC